MPLRIRADLHVNAGSRKLIFVAVENEKPEHLAIKLAAYIAFWDEDLTVEPSAKHPALAGSDLRPDLLGTDITGALSLWIDCGNTSLNKISKALKRHPGARIAVFKEDSSRAARFRADLEAQSLGISRVEIYFWPPGAFRLWCGLLGEKTEVYGEAGGIAMNLVVNEKIYTTDFLKLAA